MLEVAGGNKDEVGDTQRQCSPAGPLGLWTPARYYQRNWGAGDIWRREKNWAMWDPDQDSLQSG